MHVVDLTVDDAASLSLSPSSTGSDCVVIPAPDQPPCAQSQVRGAEPGTAWARSALGAAVPSAGQEAAAQSSDSASVPARRHHEGSRRPVGSSKPLRPSRWDVTAEHLRAAQHRSDPSCGHSGDRQGGHGQMPQPGAQACVAQDMEATATMQGPAGAQAPHFTASARHDTGMHSDIPQAATSDHRHGKDGPQWLLSRVSSSGKSRHRRHKRCRDHDDDDDDRDERMSDERGQTHSRGRDRSLSRHRQCGRDTEMPRHSGGRRRPRYLTTRESGDHSHKQCLAESDGCEVGFYSEDRWHMWQSGDTVEDR